MRYIRKIKAAVAAMSEPSAELVLWALKLSCVMLVCSMLIFAIVGLDPRRYEAYCCAVCLLELPQSVLLLAGIFSVCIEDRLSGS